MSTASGVPEANAPARRSDVQIVRYEKYIDNELRKTRRQVRMVDLTWGGMALLTGALAYLFVIALVDQWVVSGGLGHGARAVALFLFLAGAIGWIAWAVAPLLFRRINPIYAANAIEQARPTLKNGLVNFMMLRGHPESISPAVFAQIEKQAAQGLSQAPLENTVDRSHLLKLAYVLLGIVAVLAIYKVASPKDPIRSVRRVLAPWADIAAPTRVRINSVEPGEASAFHGRFVKVSADITGLRRDEAPQIFFSTTDGQIVGQSLSMNVPPGELRYVAELPPNQGGLQQDMEYWIVAGDATSVHYPIHVLTTPSMVVEKIEVRPPNYTGLEWYTVERQGDIAAIEGTEVVIHATANEDIKTAAIDFECNGSRDVQMQVDGRQATVKFPLAVKKNGESEHASYQLRFTNNDGEENPEPVRHKIEVTPDRAPEIVFTAPIAKDDELQTIQPNELLNLAVRAADPDFKLKDVKIVVERNALPLVSSSLLPAAEAKFDGSYLLNGAKQKLKAGDKLEYWAEAIDNKLPNPNRTLTSKRQLRVAALDPRANREKQPGGRGDGDDADPRGGQDPKRDPRQEQKADPKNPRDANPRRNPDRPRDTEQANDRTTEPQPGEDAVPPRQNVDDPRDPDADKQPETPKKPGESNKDNRAKPDRDPSQEQQKDPAQPNEQDAADQPKQGAGDKPKEQPDKPVDGNADPASVIKKALEKRAKELEKQNPSQQDPQKDPPQKDPKQNPDQPNQDQADPNKQQQNDESEKPKPNKPPKKEKSQESQGDSSGGAGESQGNEKGDGDSDGKGEAGDQGASSSKPNKSNNTQKSDTGAGEGNEGGDPGKGNDPNQSGQPKPNDKGGRGKSPADQNKGDGSKGDAGNQGANADQPKEGKDDGAGRQQPDKNNPGGKGNAAKPDKNRDPDGAGANGEKPEGAKPNANEKPNDKPGAKNERGPKADPGAKPGDKDPKQDDDAGDDLNTKGKPNDEGKKPGDPQKTGERTKGEQQGTDKEGAADDSPDGQQGPETQNPGDSKAGGKNSNDPTKKPPKSEKGVGQGPPSGKPGEKPEGADSEPGDDASESGDKADENAKKLKKAPKNADGAEFDEAPKDADPSDPDAPAGAQKPDRTGKPKQQSGDKSQQPQPGENPQPGQRGQSEKQPGVQQQSGQKQKGDKQDNQGQSSAGQQPSQKPDGSEQGGQQPQDSGSSSPNSKPGNNQSGGEKPSPQATPQAQNDASKPAEQAGADADSKNSDTGEAKAPSDSKKQSPTKGQQDGDRDGAGGAGGGQKSKSPGQGSPGQNTDAQEGGGRSNQSGDGETGNRPGDKKPGTPEQGAKPSGKPGEGTTTRPGEQKQAGQTTAQRNQPGGQGPGNGEAQQGPAPGNPTGGSGLASDTKAADNPPSEQRQNTPTEDEANLEYAKKQTDLALEYLKDQLAKGKPDQELLDELKWSRDDMENFVKQWERFKKQANTGDPAERKQFEQRLEDLGLRPKATTIKGGAAQEHRNQVLRDSKRSEPPAEYSGQYRAFNGGAAKSRQGK